ncbi:hypothetical protein [Variovorax sp. Root434]|uniref:hypothetical protein n=1 Tax=Variovorax sp. Root434 TaxID=1736536 RepID=UPI000B0D6C42|nr:hypothetical protein [Variovorax sp. Root434]
MRRDIPLVRLRFVPKTDSDALALREGRIDLEVGTLFDKGPEMQASLLCAFETGCLRVGAAGAPVAASLGLAIFTLPVAVLMAPTPR